MNSSSSSGSLESPLMLSLIKGFGYVDMIMRSSFLVTHVIYFIIIWLVPKLKTIEFFQMHQVNVCGLFQSFLYTSWIGSVVPALSSEYANFIVCQISEFCSSVFKYSRSYAIFVLACYRIIAVYKFHSYKSFSRSYMYTIVTSAFVWITPILIFFIDKYLTGSGPGYFCADGCLNLSFYLKICFVY